MAADLTQETFTRALDHLPSFQYHGYSYRTYLLTIAHNILVNFFRQKPFMSISLEHLLQQPPIINNIQEKISNQLDLENFWKAVSQVNHSERDALLLRYREDMSIKEIARVMNKTPNAVKVLLSKARKKLKNDELVTNMLQAPEITPPSLYQTFKPKNSDESES